MNKGNSKFLAKAIGIYLLIISIAFLMNMPKFTATINNMMFSPPIMLIAGCMTLIIGILMVLSHNIWEWDWRVLVTLVSWLVLIKGAAIILFPSRLDQLTLLFIQNKTFAYACMGIDFVLGVALVYFGFRRK